jgi:antitoxin HicB
MISYPVRLEPRDKGRVLMTFPDVPEVKVEGANEDNVFKRAPAALEKALGGYVLDGRVIPHPTDICGAPIVSTEKFSLVGIDSD